MHLLNTRKRGGDAALQICRIGPGSCDLYKRAKQWAASTNFNA
jgi:hypothetical protein